MQHEQHVSGKEYPREIGAACGAGWGYTRDRSHIDKLNERIASGEFAQSGLEQVAKNLKDNGLRLRNMAEMPPVLFSSGRVYERAAQYFRHKHGVTWPEATLTDSLTPEQCHKENLAHAELEEWWLSPKRVAGGRIDLVEPFMDEASGGSNIKEDYFGMLVIHAWSIFETLSEDLWEAALNAHPTTLSRLAGRPRSVSHRKSGPYVSTGSDNSENASRISVDRLQQHGFDVRAKMGTIHMQCRSVFFRTLSDIRESYHRAFSKDSATIDEVLDDAGLQDSAAVRNLLVHKRGIVDKEFIQQFSKIGGKPVFADGDKLPITGELSQSLSDNCQVCAAWLINSVHAWIVSHPES